MSRSFVPQNVLSFELNGPSNLRASSQLSAPACLNSDTKRKKYAVFLLAL